MIKNKNKMQVEWTEQITNTVHRWSKILTRLSIVYDEKADQMKSRIRVGNTIMLIIGLISLVVGLLQLSESSLEYRILIVVSTALTELVTGFMTISQYDTQLEIYSRYNEKLKVLLGIIATQLSLPEKFRTPGDVFIKQNMEQYQKILMEKPNVPGRDMNYSDIENDNGSTLHRQLPEIVFQPEHNSRTTADIRMVIGEQEL